MIIFKSYNQNVCLVLNSKHIYCLWQFMFFNSLYFTSSIFPLLIAFSRKHKTESVYKELTQGYKKLYSNGWLCSDSNSFSLETQIAFPIHGIIKYTVKKGRKISVISEILWVDGVALPRSSSVLISSI